MTDQEEWKMAKVSILMPACNVEKFLKECGPDYKLCEINEIGRIIIGVKYKNYTARFDVVA